MKYYEWNVKNELGICADKWNMCRQMEYVQTNGIYADKWNICRAPGSYASLWNVCEELT